MPHDHDRHDLSEGAPHGLEPAGSKGGRGRLIGRTKGFEGRRNCPADSFARKRNTKLHTLTDRDGRPVRLFVSAGQVSDCKGALAHQGSLPEAEWLIADWFRNALSAQKIRTCIPPRKSRSAPIEYDKRRYRRRHRIEIVFGRIKDWHRIATRHHRCPKVFLPAIDLAATVIYWL